MAHQPKQQQQIGWYVSARAQAMASTAADPSWAERARADASRLEGLFWSALASWEEFCSRNSHASQYLLTLVSVSLRPEFSVILFEYFLDCFRKSAIKKWFLKKT